MSELTFIGLGAMGSAIVQVLLENNCDLTVWNRSPEKADRLVSLGAKRATSIEEAIAASPRIMICIDSFPNTQKLLDTDKIRSLLPGKLIVQLSTGTPAEAREAESWVTGNGGELIAATIMVYPISIGKPDAQFLVSGPENVYQDCARYFSFLGKDVRYLGSSIGASAALNLAVLSRLVANTIGIVHGAHVCESEGVDLVEFARMFPEGDRAQTIVKAIRTNDFTVDGGASVDTAAGVAKSLQSQAKNLGINSELPDFSMGIIQRAIDAGYQDQESAAQIKILRRDK